MYHYYSPSLLLSCPYSLYHFPKCVRGGTLPDHLLGINSYQDFLSCQDNTAAPSRRRHGDGWETTGLKIAPPLKGGKVLTYDWVSPCAVLDIASGYEMWVEPAWISGKDRHRSYLIYLNKKSLHYIWNGFLRVSHPFALGFRGKSWSIELCRQNLADDKGTKT